MGLCLYMSPPCHFHSLNTRKVISKASSKEIWVENQDNPLYGPRQKHLPNPPHRRMSARHSNFSSSSSLSSPTISYSYRAPVMSEFNSTDYALQRAVIDLTGVSNFIRNINDLFITRSAMWGFRTALCIFSPFIKYMSSPFVYLKQFSKC